jgi:hypothetical protein
MGQKNPRRPEADQSKRPQVSRSPKVEHSARSLFIPAALFVGFVIGTFFGRPLFFNPLAESTSPTEQSPDPASTPKAPEIRTKTVTDAIKCWVNYDPTAAQQFIFSTPALDQKTKKRPSPSPLEFRISMC